MPVDIELIKKLRETTGMGYGKCKAALEKCHGDLDLAFKELLKEGARIAEKKTTRTASEGVIGCYSHHNLRIGALVEVRCETDFVAKNEDFRAFASEVAMQVAGRPPLVIRREELPEELLRAKKAELTSDVSDKPPQVQEKILNNRLENFYREVVLLEQPYLKDESKTVKQLLDALVGKLGENIQIVRFVRFELGQQNATSL